MLRLQPSFHPEDFHPPDWCSNLPDFRRRKRFVFEIAAPNRRALNLCLLRRTTAECGRSESGKVSGTWRRSTLICSAGVLVEAPYLLSEPHKACDFPPTRSSPL